MAILVGTGAQARAALRALGGEITGVIDPWRPGGRFGGFPVGSSAGDSGDADFIVASMYYAEVCQRLIAEGVAPDRIHVYYQGQRVGYPSIAAHVERVLATERFFSAHVAEAMRDVPGFGSRERFLEFCVAHMPRKGLLLEFGVLDGASLRVLSRAAAGRRVFGFDSFEGLPADWTFGYPRGALSRGGSLPRMPRNVTLLKGWFHDTLPAFLEAEADPVALVHLDADVYESTKYVLDRLMPRMMEGTVLVFDEYLYCNDPGCSDFRALRDWREQWDVACRYLARSDHRVAVMVEAIRRDAPEFRRQMVELVRAGRAPGELGA